MMLPQLQNIMMISDVIVEGENILKQNQAADQVNFN